MLAVALAFAWAGALLLAPRAAWAQDGARRDDRPAPPPAKKPSLTSPPVLLQAAAPVYPPEAARAGLEAAVKLKITVDAAGAVVDAQVVEPAGHGFDEAAMAAARQYRFKPAEWDGVPGAITVETTIRFVLQKKEVEVPAGSGAGAGAGAGASGGAGAQPNGAGQGTGASAGAGTGAGASPDGHTANRAPPPPPGHAGDPRLPITIQGTAYERGVRRRLPGVIVSVAELGLDAVTDDRGQFYFHGVPPGHYTLIAVDSKYDRFRRDLHLGKNEQVDVSLYLRPLGGNPYETVVEGQRETLEVTRRTLTRRQLTTVPGTFGDPIRVIQALPGLARSPFGSGFLLIRGSNPDDSGVFIDGHRVPLLFHFLGGPSVLNPEFLDSIDLYPGGFPARFGRAIGGIVSVETRAARSDGIHGAADVNLLDSGAYLRFPVGKHAALALAGRRSYLDLMLGFFLPDPKPGNQQVVVPIYDDYQARFDVDLQSQGTASLFLIGSGDSLDVLSKDADAERSLSLDSAIHFFRLIGTYRRPVSGGYTLTLSPAWGRDSITYASSTADASSAYTSIDATETTLSYLMKIEGKPLPWVTLNTGVDLESRVTRYDLLAPLDFGLPENRGADIAPTRFRRGSDMFGYGLYADLALDIGPARIIPGLRLDGYFLDGNARFSVDPRIVVRVRLGPRWLAKGYIGMFHQPPQPEAFDELFGNPGVGLEHAIQTGVGAEWKPAEKWSVDGEGYYIARRDQVEFRPDVVRDPDTGEVTPINFANSLRGDTIGFELLVKRAITRRLYGWLSYTLSRTRQKRYDSSYHLSNFDQTHVANAVASYKLPHNWEVGARFRLSSGRPTTPVVGGTFDADDGDYSRVNGETRSTRVKLFHQLDVRVEKTWVFDTWMIGAYLDVQNVYNRANVEAVQYDYRYRDSAPVTSVPILPTLGVRGQW